MAKILHAHLYGNRDTKYDHLMQYDISNTTWSELLPQKPFYLLTPQNTQLLTEYEQCWKITEIMPKNSVNLRTHRDSTVIDFDKDVLLKRIQLIHNSNITDEWLRDNLDLHDNRDWSLIKARQELVQISNLQDKIRICHYRPFDFRWIFYDSSLVEYPCYPVVGNFCFPNLGFTVTRQTTTMGFHHVLATEHVTELKCSSHDRGGYSFPLYIYAADHFSGLGTTEQRRPNLSQSFLNNITAQLGYTPTPEAIFYYIYAIFHSPTYRSRYTEFLKIDFPRVPLTSNDKLFRKLAAYGEELAALHLMKAPKLDQPITQFVEQGANRIVDAAHPKYANSKVTINKKGDGFTGVPEEVWNFYVGGYPVCAKWLKDRKGRTLSNEDIAHYQRIVVALQETIKLMAAIDQAIPDFPIT